MKNQNTSWNRFKAFLSARWKASDYPKGEPRFQVLLFVKDIGIFILIPIVAVVLSRSCSVSSSGEKRKIQSQKKVEAVENNHSQVIEFKKSGPRVQSFGGAKRAPGTLIKVRLMNVVEAYSSTPVYAQIVDKGLGDRFFGGTLIGDGVSDTGFQRINITFRIARDPSELSIAFPVAARALSLDGTLGVAALKKEGVFARAVYGGATTGTQDAQTSLDSVDLKSIVIKALSAGLLHEFGAGTQVERNRAQVLALRSGAEFFAELTDYFPSEHK
jgi:hypothetical protein